MGAGKTYRPLPWKHARSTCDNANAQVVSCARARGGGIQSVPMWPCRPTVQPCLANRPQKRGKGGGAFDVWDDGRHDTPCTRMWTLNPVLRGIQQMAGQPGRSGGARKNSGGARPGAGRPRGSRNKPVLIHGLPETSDPLQWLLALMNHPGAPLRLRMNAAKALLPYCHAKL